MTLAIRQAVEAIGEHRWSWSAWLDGPAEELDQVDSVAWLLHPTFPDPVQVRQDRASRFRVDAIGWGVFTIRAKIDLRGGGELVLEHELDFGGDPGADPRKEPIVFLSHASADRPTAVTLRRHLEENGMRVLDASTALSSATTRAASIDDLIEGSDVLVAVVSPHTSPWVVSEAEAASGAGVPVLPVLTEGRTDLPPALADRKAVAEVDLAAAANAISDAALEILFAKMRRARVAEEIGQEADIVRASISMLDEGS